jgi:hypothetical protein
MEPTMRNFLYSLLILLSTVVSNARIPLNPILGKGGTRLDITINTKPGFVGWLDVWMSGSKQRVLAAKTDDELLFCYYHPLFGTELVLKDPTRYSLLPQGLFVFDENIGKISLEKQYVYFANLTPDAAKNIPAQTANSSKKFLYDSDSHGWYSEVLGKKDRYDSSKAKYIHPTPDTESIIAVWPSCDNKNQRLFRPWIFYDALGVMEEYYCAFPKDFRLEFFPLKNHPALGNGVADIELVPLRETIKEVYAQLKDIRNNEGTLTIIDGYQRIADGEEPETVFRDMDTRALLEDPANADAVVHIASNLDGLEGGMAKKDAMITTMQLMPTQGEEASLASMGAAIVRKYLAPSYNMIQPWVNKKYVTVDEGRVSKIMKAPMRNDVLDLTVIVHSNVMVTSGFAQGYGGYKYREQKTGKEVFADLFPGFIDMRMRDAKGCENGQRVYIMDRVGLVKEGRDPLYLYNRSKPGLSNTLHNPRHTVTQIFTAALDLDPWRISGKYANDDTSKMVARTLTTGMYVATILEAIRRDKKKLYLTLVGAGSFKNPLSWISDALASSFTDTELFNTRVWDTNVPPADALSLAEAIHRSGIKVYLMIYPDPRPGSVLKGREAFVKDIKEQFLYEILPPCDMHGQLTSFAQALNELGHFSDR